MQTARYTRAAGVALWMYASMIASAAAVAARQHEQWGANYFPNVTLTTQHGDKVRFYDDLIKGKIVAINLIYTSCKYACPLETARLAQVQKLVGDRMGRDVFFYSITIDPEHDTPAVLSKYAETFQAGPGWLFLTGARADIDLISRKTGLYSPPNPANRDGHTPYLLVGNEVTGQWLRNSGVDDPRFLATTIGTWLNSWQTAPRPARSYAAAPAIASTPGAYAFTKHCAACHTIGGGDRIGPDLGGVTARRDRAWLTRFIAAPDVVRAEGDEIALAIAAKYRPAIMPALGLGRADVAQIIDFLDGKSGPGARRESDREPSPSAAVPDALVTPYLIIQRALNAGTLERVEDSARTLAGAASAIGPPAAAIRSAAAKLDHPSSLSAAREAFVSLSRALIAYAKEQQTQFAGDVKIAYCPMLREYWLQRGDTIENPFYGERMSDCGRFVNEVPSLEPRAQPR